MRNSSRALAATSVRPAPGWARGGRALVRCSAPGPPAPPAAAPTAAPAGVLGGHTGSRSMRRATWRLRSSPACGDCTAHVSRDLASNGPATRAAALCPDSTYELGDRSCKCCIAREIKLVEKVQAANAAAVHASSSGKPPTSRFRPLRQRFRHRALQIVQRQWLPAPVIVLISRPSAARLPPALSARRPPRQRRWPWLAPCAPPCRGLLGGRQGGGDGGHVRIGLVIARGSEGVVAGGLLACGRVGTAAALGAQGGRGRRCVVRPAQAVAARTEGVRKMETGPLLKLRKRLCASPVYQKRDRDQPSSPAWCVYMHYVRCSSLN